MKKSMQVMAFLMLGCFLTLVGCQNNPMGVVPASGEVKLDGVPLAGATVTFIPQDEKGQIASATTDDAGKFQLNTPGSPIPGAIPGSYTATVTKMDQVNAHNTEATEDEKIGSGTKSTSSYDPPPAVKHITPDKYRTHTTSDLKCTVEKGGKNNFPLELSTK